jgi:hypothetical protein
MSDWKNVGGKGLNGVRYLEVPGGRLYQVHKGWENGWTEPVFAPSPVVQSKGADYGIGPVAEETREVQAKPVTTEDWARAGEVWEEVCKQQICELASDLSVHRADLMHVTDGTVDQPVRLLLSRLWQAVDRWERPGAKIQDAGREF